MPAALRAARVTDREAEVLHALGARLTNVEIAERLYISVRTVESHVSALLRKLGEPDRRALALRARSLSEAASTPFPRSLGDAIQATPLVGRVNELDRLERLGDLTHTAGVRRLALLSGDAGIGKSRLAAEAASRLHAAGATVIHGRCTEGALIPYQPFSEAIRPLLTGDDPIIGLAPPGSDEEGTGRYQLFEDFDRVLAAHRTAVVFVLDDVQWADPSALQLLRHLLHRADRSSLLVIATARPEARDPHHRVAATLAAAQSAGAVEAIALAGLSAAEAETLAGHLNTFHPERSRMAWERTGGNPFLLSELLRHPQAGGELPTTARDAIVARVAGLGPAVFDALAAAAVAGEAFRIDPLLTVLGGDASAHFAAIDRAYAAGLLVEDSSRQATCRFAHAIVREALASVTSPSQRSRWHLLHARALEALGPAVAPDVARHRHAALPDGDPTRARLAAVAAFHHSMNALAYELAVSFADMALDALDAGGGNDTDRAEVLLGRGRAHLRAGDLGRATADCRAAFQLATRCEMPGLRAESVLAWADASPVWGRDPELRAALDKILADGVDDVGRQARLKAKLAQLLYYEDDDDRRRQLSREAIDDARHSGRGDVLASVLAATHAAAWDPAGLEQRIALAREIVTIGSSSQLPESELQGLGWLAVDLLEAGDRRAADDAFARHRAVAERLGQRLALRDVELWAAMRAILDGRFDDAPDHIERSRDLGEAARDPGTDSIHLVQRFWLAVEADDHAELDALVDAHERILAENTDVPAWRAALALLHVRRGDEPAARAEFETLAADDFHGLPPDAVWLNAITYLAEGCAFLHDEQRAPLLFQMLAPYAGRIAVIDRALACKGSVDRFLGLLAATMGDVEMAEHRLRRALAHHEAMRAIPLAARTRRELQQLVCT